MPHLCVRSVDIGPIVDEHAGSHRVFGVHGPVERRVAVESVARTDTGAKRQQQASGVNTAV